jgi:hypothetical protein
MTTSSRREPKPLARIAGVLYLILAVCSGFAFFQRWSIIKSDSAAATADNIRSSSALFRAGLLVDLVGMTAFLFTAMALYLLLNHVNQLVAAAMVTFVAVSVAIHCLNLLNQATALSIATSDTYRSAFGAAGADAQVMLFADRLQDGTIFAQVFFGLWLVPLGYLAIKSGWFPKVLGVLLMVACFSYVVEVFVHFIARDFEETIAPYGSVLQAISEVLFVGWLLVKGVRTHEHDGQGPNSTRQFEQSTAGLISAGRGDGR